MATTATKSPMKTTSNKPLTEQQRVDLAFKQAAAHARKQLAAQGLKLPTQSWGSKTIRNRITTQTA
jgi:hypothetical protein